MDKRSKPAKTRWTDLALRGGSLGREDCQEGWHRLVAGMTLGTILDVGSGLGKSKERISNLTTQDPAPDLVGIDVTDPVEKIPQGSYDCVTAFDVIEHVEDDLEFLRHLCRIARSSVFVTTPNEEVSKAANGCHCREYTPEEFLSLVKGASPKYSLWVGDGRGSYPVRVSEDYFPEHTLPHQAALIGLTNLGKWSPWYSTLKHFSSPRPYGLTSAYQRGAFWLRHCDMIEDWGCGMGYFRTYVLPPQRYYGLDGTSSPFCHEVVDLAIRRSLPPVSGIFMRGVLEHERRWRDVLANAVASFKDRMCLVIFTPFGDVTKEIHWVETLGVPDISFSMDDLTPYFDGVAWYHEDVVSDTGYGKERIFYLRKGA